LSGNENELKWGKGRNSHICKGKLLALFFWFLLIMMMINDEIISVSICIVLVVFCFDHYGV